MSFFSFKKELKLPKKERIDREEKRYQKLEKRLAKKNIKYLDKILGDFGKGKDEWL
jgi:hypothetical protein